MHFIYNRNTEAQACCTAEQLILCQLIMTSEALKGVAELKLRFTFSFSLITLQQGDRHEIRGKGVAVTLTIIKVIETC